VTPFDMSTADESAANETYDPLPKGKYLAEITDCEERETGEDAPKFPEVPMIWFEFTVRKDGYDGRKAWTNIVIPDGDDDKSKEARRKALGRFKALLRATGVYSDKQLDSKKFDFNPDDVIDSKVTIDLRVDKKRDQNRVVRVLSASASDDDENGEDSNDDIP
jgi:Protein of unknown function (DUF669)